MDNNVVDNYEFMGKSLKQWDEDAQKPTDTIPVEKATEMGIIRPQEVAPQQSDNQPAEGNKFTQTLDNMGVETPDVDKEYQKLNVAESLLDVGKTVATEASHLFTPKKYEAQYESKTRIGEASKFITRYGLGAIGFAVGGGAVGAGVKAIGVAAEAGKVIKAGEFIQKAFSFSPFKAAADAGKVSKGVTALGNALFGGALPSALAAYKFYDPSQEEGHMADAFGNSDNSLVQYLQSDENDTAHEAKLKNAVEDFIVNAGFGVAISALPKVVEGVFKGYKNLTKANTEAEGKEALKDIMKANSQLESIGSTSDLLDKVKEIHTEAGANGTDASAMIREQLPLEHIDDADAMLKHIDDGNDIHINEDGSFDIKVSSWEDASKVSPEAYKAQHPDGIQHMDEAVKQTWVDRGMIGSNEELNAKTSNKIAKNYKDKWKLDNNVKVEFIDGLTHKGTPVEGFTQSTEYLGKTTKTVQNNIDKKKLQIQQLQDKLTMLEGGNAEVSDPLDVVKEQLRIANNELKELDKAVKVKNKIPDITIKIDKNSPNPYAVLRSELEHARDVAKNEVPKTGDKHFARYNGKNESEMSSEYVYKKSQSRAGVSSVTDSMDASKGLVKDAGGINTPATNATAVKDPLIQSQNEQLKLDFNTKLAQSVNTNPTTENIVKDIYHGNMRPETTGDINQVIETIAKIDPEISGKTWLDFTKDGEIDYAKLQKFIDDNGIDSKTAQQLLTSDDARTIHQISIRSLAKTKLIGQVFDTLQGMWKNTPVETQEYMQDLFTRLHTDVDSVGSAFGRGLNERKVVNESKRTFSLRGLSAMDKEGINTFTDMLNEMLGKESKLFFTRTAEINLNQVKERVINGLLEKGGDYATLLSDEVFRKNLDKSLDSILLKAKKTGNIDSKELANEIRQFVAAQRTAGITEVTKLAPNDKSLWKTYSNWFRGNVPAYYVHNLLSSPTTLIKNVVSGGANSMSFALTKMVGGVMGGGEKLTQEGIDQLVGLHRNFAESFELGKQAFINGDGLLTNMSKDTLNESTTRGLENLDEVFKSGTIVQKLQAVHSVMTRAMGASDEFMTQLNYRSIAYAKSLGDAREIAKGIGKEADEAYISKTADEIFSKTKFNEAGLPTDVDAFHEAKSILYQTPLNGKMMNHQTGELQQMREQTMLMKIGQSAQQKSDEFPAFKLVLPFVKTPTNILQMAIDHSELARFSPATQRVLKGGGKEAALAKARIAMGNTSFLMGASLALSGMITGALPADKEERAALLKSGWRPYSWKVINPIDGSHHYVSYQGYEPIATILGTGADLVQLGTMIASPEDEDKFGKIAQQAGIVFTNNFIDKAYFRTALTQMNVVFNSDAVSPTQIQNVLGSMVAGATLPDSSGVKALSTLGTVDARKPENIIQTALSGYGNRGLGQFRRNEFGEKQSLTNLLVTKSYDVESNPEDRELRRLAEQGYSPTEINKLYGEYKIKLTDFKNPKTGQNAFDAMNEEMGKVEINGMTLRQAVGELIMSDYYNNVMNDLPEQQGEEAKSTLINHVYQDYIQYAKDEVSTRDEFVDKDGNSLSDKHYELQQKQQDASINNQSTDIREKLNSIF